MKPYISRIFLLVVVLSVGSCNFLSEKMSGDLPIIGTEALAAGLAAQELFVIDNNTPAIFKKNHIPSAVHMDPRNADVSLLPTDKDAKLVFYCKNTWCMASHAGARFALEQGYQNSSVYAEGIDGWIKAGKPGESGI